MTKRIDFVKDDGGREAAGYKGSTGDCVTRSLAIAMNLPYWLVYDEMAKGNATQRRSKHSVRRKHGHARTASHGIWTQRKWFKDYMVRHGWEWVPTMQIGQGCKVHLRADELPKGRIIVALSRHYAAVIDGVLHDTHDCSRDGTRCVYGYWRRKAPKPMSDQDKEDLKLIRDSLLTPLNAMMREHLK